MAEQRTKKDTTALWFVQKLVESVDQLPSQVFQTNHLAQTGSIAVEQLNTESFQSKIELIERNHSAFFNAPFEIHFEDPVKAGVKKTVANDQAFFALVDISTRGISIKQKPFAKGQDVIIADLDTLVKNHPNLATDLENAGIGYGNSVASTLVNVLASNALVIFVPAKIEINEIIHIEIVSDSHDAIVPMRLIVHLGESAKANLSIKLVSSENSREKNIIAFQTDCVVNENAQLNILRHQTLNNSSLVMIDDAIRQDRSSKVSFFNFDEGAKGLSSVLSLALNGEGAEASITGVYRPREDSKYYYDTEQIHAASYSESDLLYDGVIGESAYASWKGNIVVEKGTKGTNGYQANNNLIIHDSGKVESVPGLEIITDDVRCSHGVTIGNIDKNHMFYLQSRGINEEEAEALIINGFIQSSLNRIKTDVYNHQISQLFDI